MSFPLYLALRYLKPHRNGISAIAVIAVVGILLGVAVQMIVMAVMTGYGEVWNEKILSFKPHVTIQHMSGLITDLDEVEAVVTNATPEVAGVCPAAQTPVMVRCGDRIQTPIAVGFDMDRPGIIDTVREHMLAGRFDIGDRNCVLGSGLAYDLGVACGDTVLVYSPLNLANPDELYLPEELTVAGIFDMGMRDYDSAFLLASLEVVLDLVGEFGGAQALQVQVANPYEVYPPALSIARALGPEYRVQTWQQADAVLFGALQTEKTMMFVLLVVISIVAVFCVVNTLIVVTLKKTREIGLLKALGFTNGRIVGVFVLMGQIQCVAGTLLGVLCGWCFLHRLNDIVAFLAQHGRDVFPKEIYMFSDMPWRIVPGDLLLTVVSVHLFCLLASLVPAWRAARMDPVVALGQE